MSAAELARLSPHFSWDRYFEVAAEGDARLAPSYAVVNATEPSFFRALDLMTRTAPLGDIKTYLRWHSASAFARTSSSGLE